MKYLTLEKLVSELLELIIKNGLNVPHEIVTKALEISTIMKREDAYHD